MISKFRVPKMMRCGSVARAPAPPRFGYSGGSAVIFHFDVSVVVPT